jgi:hypothetical protein
VTPRVVLVNSATPTSFSRAATIRDALGCESPTSRPATEKLPVLATRMKSWRARKRSIICFANENKSFFGYYHENMNEPSSDAGRFFPPLPAISSFIPGAALDHHLANGGQEVKRYGTFRV